MYRPDHLRIKVFLDMSGPKRALVVIITVAIMSINSLAMAGEIPFFATYPHIDFKRWYISSGWSNGDHQSCEWRDSAISVADRRLVLTLSSKGGKTRPLGCGEIHTQQRTGYGRYEARMRAASGSGLNSAFFTYVGPPTGNPQHDEIDFEFLGKNPTQVQVTWWTNGQRHEPFDIDLGFDASKGFHNYAFEWRKGSIRWFVDDKLMHETPKGADIPSHPGLLYLSLWSGSKIEDDWMGPFTYKSPVTAEFATVRYSPLP